MSRADYASTRSAQVMLKIREASHHPKAPLIFAIGAECPSPQSAASAAYALGLTNQEEQLAKWAAILKRDAENLFGKPFLEALQDILKEGETEMEVKRGVGFFGEKTNPLIEKLVQDLFRDGVQFTDGNGSVLTNFGGAGKFSLVLKTRERVNPDRTVDFIKYWYPGFISKDAAGSGISISCDTVYIRGNIGPHLENHLVLLNGLQDLTIVMNNQNSMKAVRSFAKAWEKKSKQLKGSREATVTIYQDYA